MKRREFIAGLGSVAAWPVIARAQQSGMPVVGVLFPGRPDQNPQPSDIRRAYLDGLKEGLC